MDMRAAYLDLLKRSLTESLSPTMSRATPQPGGGVLVEEVAETDREQRREGRDWPVHGGMTMAGMYRLDNVQACIETVLAEEIPGDLIETGVWRGGTSIFMRAALAAYGDTGRRVFVADSFRGLPAPDPERYAADEADELFLYDHLAVSLEDVKRNFGRYGMLDERVRFVEGWFEDTLPTLRDETWSVIRLDGDMYASTWEALQALYPQLSPGGFAIIDDYGAVSSCAQAVDDFRARLAITEPLETIDWTGAFWRKGR